MPGCGTGCGRGMVFKSRLRDLRAARGLPSGSSFLAARLCIPTEIKRSFDNMGQLTPLAFCGICLLVGLGGFVDSIAGGG